MDNTLEEKAVLNELAALRYYFTLDGMDDLSPYLLSQVDYLKAVITSGASYET
ncbi:TPA: hypothetical protein ACGF6J_000726 [Vibrio cholerae]